MSVGHIESLDAREILKAFARTASFEATPKQILERAFDNAALPKGTYVYVPFLPGADFKDSLTASRRLLALDLYPVLHLPARTIASRTQLSEWLGAYTEMGGKHLLLIAGDQDRPRGAFRNTLDVLGSGLLVDHDVRSIGVAGHPGIHPVANPVELRRALEIKRDYALQTGTDMWIVTQFVFDARVFIDWLEQHQEAIDPLPVYFGMAGPTSMTTVMFYAAQCGVSASARMLKKRRDAVRLLHSWSPDGLIKATAHHRVERPESPIKGVHVFPFGGLERSLQWLDALLNEPDVAQRATIES